MHPSPATHCLPTPGTTRRGPSVQPSVQAVSPGLGRDGAGSGRQADLLGQAGLSGPVPRPQAARCRPWSAEISWTAPPWPPTTAAPIASCPGGSVPATQSPAPLSECRRDAGSGHELLGSEGSRLPNAVRAVPESDSERWGSLVKSRSSSALGVTCLPAPSAGPE